MSIIIDNLEDIKIFEEDIDFGNIELLENERICDILIIKQDIENLISRLEKLEIIGENVLKYWEKDKILCELKKKPRIYN